MCKWAWPTTPPPCHCSPIIDVCIYIAQGCGEMNAIWSDAKCVHKLQLFHYGPQKGASSTRGATKWPSSGGAPCVCKARAPRHTFRAIYIYVLYYIYLFDTLMWRDGATKKLFSIIASSWVLDIARARPKHFALFWWRYIYFYPRGVCITQELMQTHNLQLLLLLSSQAVSSGQTPRGVREGWVLHQ